MKKLSGFLLALAVPLFLIDAPGRADVKVRTDFDKSFDFSKLRTWAWNDAGAGDVKMARTADDDPEAVRQQAEPVIKESVAAELARRGLQAAAPGAAPDFEITYYLLLTLGSQSQYVGEFLGAVPEWGLPPFTGATQSFKMVNQGSLVLDISANNEVVWRGVGQAEIKMGESLEKRQARIREAVREILKRYPPKK
jgi:hypothetical protein